MNRHAMSFLTAAALLVSGHAMAQEPIANRFTMEKTENGFIRMDTLTGEMSMCSEQAGQIVCRLAADERRAFEETLSDLTARVESLEKRLDAIAPGSGAAELPDEAELDRALTAMEKMMRRFFGMVEELRKDFGEEPGAPPEPLPDRT